MKFVSIVGARPQFIKASALTPLLRARHEEILVHTGQHYDQGMSDVFFNELGLPEPDVNLNVGSGPHGAQTAAMLTGIEDVLGRHKPDAVVVYGDTNSTLAGALGAAKLGIRLAHVEAGLRSYNRSMPEEINRVLTDHAADLLLCPAEAAAQNLAREGIARGVHIVGDIMADVLRSAKERAALSSVLQQLRLDEDKYVLATVHRAENTDDPTRLGNILSAFNALEETVVFPVHPRTRAAIIRTGWQPAAHVRMLDPVGYLDMIRLQQSARGILTDSGGVQKEAYWLGTPCVTLRNETEWVETVTTGWNTLAGANTSAIVSAVASLRKPSSHPPLYGDGHAAGRCLSILETQDS